ncbi:hypothetical protein JCM8115_004610 [Rhodotorula mucilaginosa]
MSAPPASQGPPPPSTGKWNPPTNQQQHQGGAFGGNNNGNGNGFGAQSNGPPPPPPQSATSGWNSAPQQGSDKPANQSSASGQPQGPAPAANAGGFGGGWGASSSAPTAPPAPTHAASWGTSAPPQPASGGTLSWNPTLSSQGGGNGGGYGARNGRGDEPPQGSGGFGGAPAREAPPHMNSWPGGGGGGGAMRGDDSYGRGQAGGGGYNRRDNGGDNNNFAPNDRNQSQPPAAPRGGPGPSFSGPAPASFSGGTRGGYGGGGNDERLGMGGDRPSGGGGWSEGQGYGSNRGGGGGGGGFGGGYGDRPPRGARYGGMDADGLPPGFGGRGYGGAYGGPPMRESGPFVADMPHIDWNQQKLPEFIKDFYEEHPRVTERTEAEVEEWRKERNITVEGKAAKPITSWVEARLPDYICDYIEAKHFVTPTTIQCQALPIACGGGDLVAISETGSGKTLAYAIPACMHINAQPTTEESPGPIALVVAPTRELAMQILEEFKAVGGSTGIKSVATYGGISRTTQLPAMARGAFDVLIATPGRLIDYICSEDVQLKRVTYLVIDEADRMINEGFETELDEILSCVRPDRQVLMFSATWPPEVRQLAEKYLKNATRVTVGQDEIIAAKAIKQEVEICHGYNSKVDRLMELLKEEGEKRGRVLIFVNTKRSAVDLTQLLLTDEGNWQVMSLQGDKRQEERDLALSEFRAGTTPILVATDLAQRGLDIPNVTLVVNFDAPNEITSYVHRIGRTGRAGHEGRSITFLSGSRDYKIAAEIRKVMGENDQIISEDFENYVRESGMLDTFGSLETADNAVATASTWAPLPAGGTTENESASTSTPAPAAAGWGAGSTQETSAAATGWGMPSAHPTSTESVQGSSTIESTASEAMANEEAGSSDAIAEEEQPDQSYDSGHGETSLDRSHEGDKEGVQDDVDEEIAALLKDAPVSPSSAESQPEDEAWLQGLMVADDVKPAKEKTPADHDAEPVVGNDNSSTSNVADDVGSDGSGTVTPLAERSHSPVSTAEAPAG